MTGSQRFLGRRAAVSLVFATALIPLLMIVGLSIDYGFYNQARSQLDMAADASALHAARIAAQLIQANDALYRSKGDYAGMQWFTAQLGTVPQALTNNFSPNVNVTYAASTNTITAQVNYSGVIAAHFGRLFPGNWPNYPNWGIAGSATAVISIPSYVEVVMLLDNSSSMLIGSSPADIDKMDRLTPCSTQSKNELQTIDADYSWAYVPQPSGQWLWNPLSSTYSTVPATGSTVSALTIPYGYGTFFYPGPKNTVLQAKDIVPTVSQIGQCDARYPLTIYDPTTGTTVPTAECFYPGSIPGLSQVPATKGTCLNGGGGAGSIALYPGTTQTALALTNMPQAPCAFACHNDPNSNDYWGLAQQSGVVTRYTVLHQAAGNIIAQMQKSANPTQLSVGVYQFNEYGLLSATDPGVSEVYPESGTEAGPVAGDGSTDPATATANIQPPVTDDRPDTNFENAMTFMGKAVSKAGPGILSTAPKKNLFIVTDGMDDYYYQNNPNNQRIQGPIDSTACNKLKGEGVNIYVLYTKYYPLPNPYYLQNDQASAEAPPGSAAETSTPIETALAGCSSNTPTNTQYFYEATDATSINLALNKMLAAALGSAGRLSN